MPPTAPKQVTMSYIAELSGVSRPLVSAILNQRDSSNIRFSDETRDRVLQTAKRVGYRPNRTARSLRSERHGNLGILTRRAGSVSNPVLNMMQETASADYGQCLVLGRTIGPDDPPGEPAVFLRESFVDGIVVIDHTVPGLDEQIRRVNVPSVWLNTGVDRPGAINHDEAGGIAQALAHLWQRGRRHTAIIMPPDEHYSHPARLAAMQAQCAAAGMPAPVACQLALNIYDRDCLPAITAELQAFLQAHPDVDSVILSVDILAGPLYRAAHALGLRLPDDIAVIGFNDSYVAMAVTPMLTSLRIDPFDAGRRAIHMLNSFINGGDEADRYDLPYELVSRDSV